PPAPRPGPPAPKPRPPAPGPATTPPPVTFQVAMDKVGPRQRMCRRAGVALCGRPNCPSAKRPYPPGMHGRGRKRISEYQVRLLEKQKLRHIYGVGERPTPLPDDRVRLPENQNPGHISGAGERKMPPYYERRSRKTAVTGEEMIRQ